MEPFSFDVQQITHPVNKSTVNPSNPVPSMTVRPTLRVSDGFSVRRLTPRECERLQGFPDDYTALGSDSQRYKALGNSMAVPVMRWIGERIGGVDGLQSLD